VSPYDLVTLRCTPSGTPSARKANWGLLFESSTAGEGIIMTGTSDDWPSQSAVEYNSLVAFGPYTIWTSTFKDRQTYITQPYIELSKLHVVLSTGPGSGQNYKFTIQKNEQDTDLAVTISDSSTKGADTTHSVAFDGDDDALIESDPSASVSQVYAMWGLVSKHVYTKTLEESVNIAGNFSSDYHAPIPPSGYSVFVSGSEYYRIYNVFSVKYDEPGIILTDIPRFEIETDNITGRRLTHYGVGKGCKIYRNGELQFCGEIEPRAFKKGDQGSTMTFGGPHLGYSCLKNRVCDYYRADNNSYAPVVNPWQFGRKTTTANALVDGLRPDEIMECLIGTKFIWQEWFENNPNL
jgi:hypothetical protein